MASSFSKNLNYNLKPGMRSFILVLCLALIYIQPVVSQSVEIVNDEKGYKLQVGGSDLFIKGMNWDYKPIGTNYTYSLWEQPEDLIRQVLDHEMTMLKEIGVNAIRQYTGIPKEWISYIYENYGIYTMLNHSFGRYGLSLDGQWIANTDYGDPAVEELLLSEVRQIANEFKNTEGLLLYLLGNENNYGLFWEGAETEDIPGNISIADDRARDMYSLLNKGVLAIKEIDPGHPVAICNGDLQFSEIIAEECPDMDIFGTNIYRGISFWDAFEKAESSFGKPVLLTEFGADAYNVISGEEGQAAQARYFVGNWMEICENAYGMGKTANCLGGFTFQFSDGWWKYGQTFNLDKHDTHASWSNGGYQFDYREGENNMNEEWFGICAKGPLNEEGVSELYPRMAYHFLHKIHEFDPLTSGRSPEDLLEHFSRIVSEVEDIKGNNDSIGR